MSNSHFVGAAASSSWTNEISLTVPDGIQEGDYMIATLATNSDNGDGFNVPSGWTQVNDPIFESYSSDFAIYDRTAGPSEPAAYTWNPSAGDTTHTHWFFATMEVYRDVSMENFQLNWFHDADEGAEITIPSQSGSEGDLNWVLGFQWSGSEGTFDPVLGTETANAVYTGSEDAGGQITGYDVLGSDGTAASRTYTAAPQSGVASRMVGASAVLARTTVDVSGVVRVQGTAVGENEATVIGINESDETVQDVATTDANGEYALEMPQGITAHLLVEYDGEQGTYNAQSKPFLVV